MKHLGDITKINGAEIPVVEYKVYRYTFPDGKIYIGTTGQSIQNRRDCGYHHNKLLTQAMRSAGWRNIKVDILHTTTDKAEAFQTEMRLISETNATNPQIGYNISLGGINTFAGLNHTEECKKRMSEAQKGKVFSDEHIRNLCNAHSKERKPVVRYSPHGEEKAYGSLGEAAFEIGGHKSNISRACISGKPYKGFRWSFVRKEAILGETSW